MKILITGGLGHIGSHLIRAYSKDNEVTVVDDLSTKRYCSLMNLTNPINFRETGFEELDKQELEKFEAVIHLAAVTDAARGDSKNIEKININHTRDFIQKLCNLNIPPLFIFPSSTSVYGTASKIVKEDDKNCLNPQSYYAQAKLEIENFIRKNYPSYFVLRLGTIFGVTPGMRFHTAINHFCWSAANGLPVSVWEENYEFYRPYLDVKDASRTMHHLLKKKEFNNETYNVLSGNYKCKKILDIIKERVPDLKINMVSTPLLNQFSYKVDDSKIKTTGISMNGNVRREINNTLEVLKCVRKY
tara:strand:+ start:2297 stop:3202 length:906 start_codon:yes stop_codon:yes gene_type:complete